MVNRENDANEEKKSATLRRGKSLDCKSLKAKSAYFTKQNCTELFGQLLAFSKADPELERKRTKNMTTITEVEVVLHLYKIKPLFMFLNIVVNPETKNNK